jgi:hypothetical protein
MAICRGCGAQLSSEASRFCTRCGAVQAEVATPTPAKPRWSGRQKIVAGLAVFFGLCVLVALLSPDDEKKAANKPDQEAAVAVPSATAPTTDEPSIEEKLASIDANGSVSADDITVARFRSLLDQLSQTFTASKQQIADQTVKCQELLRQQGIKESLQDIMEGMNQIFASRNHNQDYSQWLAAYVVSRNKSMSHEATIEGLKDLAHGLGAE